jgi:hypothetical protein
MSHLRPTPEIFDRLVDGELSESQHRELLASLDQEPDGWRRCALAFLEAQCWKKELGDLRQTLPIGSPTTALISQPGKRKSSPFRLPGTLLAMSACFLLALGAGVLWQQSGNRLGGILDGGGANQIAGNVGRQSATVTSTSGAQTAVAQATPQPDNTAGPWQWVRLSPAGSTDSDQTVQLPAIQRDRMDEQWLQSLPSPIPENVLQALRRNGYAVQTQQELMPMPLTDGRRLVVPVDQVELQYVGNPTY